MTAEIIAAAIGGFAGWLLIQVTRYLSMRMRVIRYLIVQINLKLWDNTSNHEWLQDIKETNIKEGVIMEAAARFTPNDVAGVSEIRPFLLEYLRANEIERLIKLFNILRESDILYEGFCLEITKYKEKEKPLNLDDVKFLKGKIKRIASLHKVLPRKIDKIKDVPVDYAGILGPDSVDISPRRLTGPESSDS